MGMRIFVPCFSLLLGFATHGALAAAAEPLPTIGEIKQAYDDKQYPQVLQKLNRVLILKGKAAESYDRHELLEIRGETQLRMKSLPAAAQSFAEAAKETNDGPSVAKDIATEILLKKSTALLQYQPKAKDPADKTKQLPPIDILEPDNRKKAIAALLTDEIAAADAVVKAARQAKSLTQILQALPTIRNVRWIEMASTGHDERSKAMVADLGTRAKTLIETSLKDTKERVDDLERLTMEVVTAHVPITDKQSGKILGFRNEFRYRGPTPRQMTEIQDIVSTCSKIFDSSDELGGSLGTTGKEFDGVKEESKTIGTRANALATKNWRQTYTQPPPTPPPPAAK